MCCCNCICPRNRFIGPTGPTGPTGPRGPLSNFYASFFQINSGEIISGGYIALNDVANLSNGIITHATASTDVVLTNVGYYKISYNSTATASEEGNVSLRVEANNTTIPQSITTGYASGTTNPQNLASSFIYYNPTSNTVLNLTNNSTVNVNFTNTNFVVEYLGNGT